MSNVLYKMKKKKLRKNGYKFLDKILPFMNDVCPICNCNLDIRRLRMYVELMKNRHASRGRVAIKRSSIDIDIDHKLPIWRGGTNDISNLQLTHRICNNIKGGREPEDWDGVIRY